MTKAASLSEEPCFQLYATEIISVHSMGSHLNSPRHLKLKDIQKMSKKGGHKAKRIDRIDIWEDREEYGLYYTMTHPSGKIRRRRRRMWWW
jgi:hypothetical protein